MVQKSHKDAYCAIAALGEQLARELLQIAIGDTDRDRHFSAFALSAKIQNVRLKPSGRHLTPSQYRRLISLSGLAEPGDYLNAESAQRQSAMVRVGHWLTLMADAWSQNELSPGSFQEIVGKPDDVGHRSASKS